MNLAARGAFVRGILKRSDNLLVPWYLLLSWLYYKHDIELVPDEDYNTLCVRLMSKWDSIEHRHKHLVTLDSLRAGTGYAITDYPSITMSYGSTLAREDGHVVWNPKAKAWLKP